MERSGNRNTVSFQLVAAAGEARSLAFEAPEKAKAGDFDAAAELHEAVKGCGNQGSPHPNAAAFDEAAGEHLSVDVLLVHAQDHLMCSMLAQELVQELICLYERTATKNA